ncbi:MAG TPA: hypothetical protein VFG59_02905 [Anaeromyxobacter sp.]|nr:hypothetical protein [Anaeromyxobacter sp.]
MRIHLLAMVSFLTAALAIGCGSAREVRDASLHSNAWGCDQCHGYPPPPFFPADQNATHPQGLTPAMCTVCHPTTVEADGHTIVAGGTHRDGQVEVRPFADIACDSCHGTPPDTGKHLFHVGRGVDCGTCHNGFDPSSHTADANVHMNGKADVIVLVDVNQVPTPQAIQTANLPDGSWPDSECAACHAALQVTTPPPPP